LQRIGHAVERQAAELRARGETRAALAIDVPNGLNAPVAMS
jgi:hypothetical protein